MVFLACHDGGNSFVFWVYFGWNDFHVEQLRFTPSQVHPSSWRHQRPYGTVHYYYWQALMRVLKSQLLVTHIPTSLLSLNHLSTFWKSQTSAISADREKFALFSVQMGNRDGVVVRRSPPTNVVRVRFRPDVICMSTLLLILSMLRGYFSNFSGFPPSRGNEISKF